MRRHLFAVSAAVICVTFVPKLAVADITGAGEVFVVGPPDFNAIPLVFGPGDIDFGVGNDLFVGLDLVGSLEVNGGSTLRGGWMSIGFNHPGGRGLVTVTGNGSLIEFTGAGNLDLGGESDGMLQVLNGGRVQWAGSNTCGDFECFTFLGNVAGATSSLMISGPGSTFDARVGVPSAVRIAGSSINVDTPGFGVPGGTTTANVQILNGGSWITPPAIVADGPNGTANTGAERSVATVIVDGLGSNWTSEVFIGVGLAPGGDGFEAVNSEGTLVVSNSAEVTTPNLFVGTGGTIRGDGTINAVIINGGGTVAPGGFSPGTLDIVGDAFFFNGGILEIEVSGLNSFDVLTVLGTADFQAGTTVRFLFDNFPDRCFVPKAGDSFRFLNAGLLMGPANPADLEFTVEGLQEGFVFEVTSDASGFDFVARTDGAPDFCQPVIDIKPGSDPNSINPYSGQRISVGMFSTVTFDASQIDVTTVAFGPNGATEVHGRNHVEDIDNDGIADLILHFQTRETGIQCGDTEATLTGQTIDGTAIIGSDAINTVNCR